MNKKILCIIIIGIFLLTNLASLSVGGIKLKTKENLNLEKNNIGTWIKTYDSGNTNYGYSVLETSDNGFIICGSNIYFDGYSVCDLWLFKVDRNGNLKWENTIDKGGHGTDMQFTRDGGLIITGLKYDYSKEDTDIFLLKTDINGNTQWIKTYGGDCFDYAYKVRQTNDNGFVFVGQIDHCEINTGNLLIIKTDEFGAVQWERQYGKDYEYDSGYDIQQTKDNGYIITGRTNSLNNNSGDLWLIKTDSLGFEEWNVSFGCQGGTDRGKQVIQTSDGGFIVAGEQNADQVWLLKTDKNGNLLWDKRYRNQDPKPGEMVWIQGYIESLQKTDDGNYLIISSVYQGKIIKVDENGNLIWLKKCNFHERFVGLNLYEEHMFSGGQQTSDGGFIIIGTSKIYNSIGTLTECNVLLIKTNENGEVEAKNRMINSPFRIILFKFINKFLFLQRFLRI